jgi:serine/threonine-protein kinase
MAAVGLNAASLAYRVADYEILGELGARTPPALVVRHALPGGRASLAVMEAFEGVLVGGNAEGASLLRRARRIASLAHPNLAQVRDVSASGDDMLVAGTFLDGEKLSQFWLAGDEAIPLEIVLRLLVGVLSALGALHRLCDAQQRPLGLAHGEIAPTTILFGIDGVARVLHTVARQAPGAEPEEASLGYLAPEIRAQRSYDERADVFGAGVLLWEALSGRALGAGGTPLGVPRATVPEGASWARGLVDVAAKALEAAPEDRWPTAAAMAAQIHQVAGPRVASVATAAAWVSSHAGEAVRARREKFEGAGTPPSESKVQPRPQPPDPDFSALLEVGHDLVDDDELAADTAIDRIPAAVMCPPDEATLVDRPAAVVDRPDAVLDRADLPDRSDPEASPVPYVSPFAVPSKYAALRRGLAAAVCAMGVIGVASGVWFGVHRQADAASASPAPAAIEAAGSPVSGASFGDIPGLGTPRLIAPAQREGAAAPPGKPSPAKRPPSHPVRGKPAPRGGGN